MDMLSTLLKSPDVYLNDKGYLWMQLLNGKVIVRKMHCEYFSNFSKNTVRVSNARYLVNDSVLNVHRAEDHTAPYNFS